MDMARNSHKFNTFKDDINTVDKDGGIRNR